MLFRLGKVWLGLVVLFVSSGIKEAVLHGEPALSALEVIARAVARAQKADGTTVRPDYTYVKATVTDEFDAAGRVREHKEKRYQVSCRSGAISAKLLEVNGHTPDGADLKKQAENEMNFGRVLGQSRAAKGEDGGNFLTPELAARFSYKLIGQTAINGRAAYQLAFEPVKPEPPVRQMIDRLLNRISGTLWGDPEEVAFAR